MKKNQLGPIDDPATTHATSPLFVTSSSRDGRPDGLPLVFRACQHQRSAQPPLPPPSERQCIPSAFVTRAHAAVAAAPSDEAATATSQQQSPRPDAAAPRSNPPPASRLLTATAAAVLHPPSPPPPAPTRPAWTRNGSPSGGWRQGLGRGGGVRGWRCSSKHHHRPVSARGDFGVCGTSLSVGRATLHSRGGTGRRGTRRGEAWGEERRRWLGHDGPCRRVCIGGGCAVGLCKWSVWGVVESAAGWSYRGAARGGGCSAAPLCVCSRVATVSGREWVAARRSDAWAPARRLVALLSSSVGGAHPTVGCGGGGGTPAARVI